MDTSLVTALTLGCSALSFGALIAVRATRLFRDASATGVPVFGSSESGGGEGKIARSTPVSTSIVGLIASTLRHRDGSYTRAWHVEMPPTMYARESVAEDRCDRLARALAADKPRGTVLQFRYTTVMDPGRAIADNQRASADAEQVHPGAQLLHAMGNQYQAKLAGAETYRHSVLTLWARVPARHADDYGTNGWSAFLPALIREVRRFGPSGLTSAWRRAWAASADDGVVRRLRADEDEAFESAEAVFRRIENECPLRLTRFGRDELWRAVYLGHSLSAHEAPKLPADATGMDLSDYLCRETIDGTGWFRMHGEFPVAMVSMFTPPQPVGGAGVTRYLTADPRLTFRHTVVVDYVALDPEQAKKKLDKRVDQVRRTTRKADGRSRESAEAEKALADLRRVRAELANAGEALLQMRFTVLVYGDPAHTRDELRASLKVLRRRCELVSTVIRQMPGADAALEDSEALQALYGHYVVGELNARATGREIEEVAESLASLVPDEGAWSGSKRPHTVIGTTTGRLIGLNFFDTTQTGSPVVVVLGAMGSGKSVWMGGVARDVLATMRRARLRAIDRGESFGPLIEVLGGRHIRFAPGEVRTINVWDYDGLERGGAPDDVQITLVVEDIKKLARVADSDLLAESIIQAVVKEVYRNEVPRNGEGLPRHEPTLSHFLLVNTSYPWKEQTIRARAAELQLVLSNYRGHAWLDAPTHPDFHVDTPADVYELDSLDKFPRDVAESLAYRVAARVVRSIGELLPDGTRTPTLICVDEMWAFRDRYPDILRAIKKAARQGRKEMVCLMLATHGYQDLRELHDITKNAGVKVVGRQIGAFDDLAADADLSPDACAAVRSISNVMGSHAQYVLAVGSGETQITEKIQSVLDPVMYWTTTSQPDERNARARVRALRPDWSMAQVVAWLAEYYPRGLIFAGLTRIDESQLPAREARQDDPAVRDWRDAGALIAAEPPSPIARLFGE